MSGMSRLLCWPNQLAINNNLRSINQQNKPVRKHIDRCIVKSLQLSDIEILHSNKQGIEHLLTLEAQSIRKIDPELNKMSIAVENLLLSFNYHCIWIQT